MLATKEQLTQSLKPAIKAGTRRRHSTRCTPSTSRNRDAEGYRWRTDAKGRPRIEIQAFRGIFQFTEVCGTLREQWKNIGIQAHLSKASSCFEAPPCARVEGPRESGGFHRTNPQDPREAVYRSALLDGEDPCPAVHGQRKGLRNHGVIEDEITWLPEDPV
jgi:hypothetical protein